MLRLWILINMELVKNKYCKCLRQFYLLISSWILTQLLSNFTRLSRIYWTFQQSKIYNNNFTFFANFLTLKSTASVSLNFQGNVALQFYRNSRHHNRYRSCGCNTISTLEESLVSQLSNVTDIVLQSNFEDMI